MKYLVFITINLIMLSTLLAVTWEIKQDGTGDFTTIGAGITVAQDGDTLLVYPGIYYERINYQGKNITITSLYDGDEYDESYVTNTIIDGNHEGTVVIFNSGETRDAVLNGFTIRHGKGEFHHSWGYTSGGGIYIRDSSPTISFCHIKNNFAAHGSGFVLANTGNPILKGSTVSFNRSIRHGAVQTIGNTNLEFCNESLNNIYLNFGGRGSDIYLGGNEQSSIVIDTLTVLNPDRYFIELFHLVPEDFTLTVNHGKIEPVAADLYVSPNGCDSNSGLTPSEPLQSIAMAMTKIAPDSLQQRTIYVADGIYSRSLNNQHFPIQMRPYVDVIGNNKDTVILDMEHETLAFMSDNVIVSHELQYDLGSFTIKNFTIVNGGNPLMDSARGAFHFYYTNMPIIVENIDVYNGYVIGGHNAQAVIYHGGASVLRNLHFYDNMGGSALSTGGHWGPFLNLYGENIRIRNNTPGPLLLPDYEGGYGGGLSMTAGSFIPEPINVTFVNLEITDCERGNIPPPWLGGPWGNLNIAGWNGIVRIINATIGNNFTSSYYGGGIVVRGDNTVELINSIVYGNSPHQIVLDNTEALTQNIIISHSLIQGGQGEIVYYQNSNSVVNWGEGNIDANPLWLGVVDPDYTGDYPYMLSEYSPARNAGTLDIPNFEFPLYDLAGNPRIYGDSIDIGAYEWNPEASIDDNDTYHVTTLHNYNLHNYPNPVVSLKGMGRGKGVGTNISFIMPKEGHVVIDIYNVKGQFIRRLINAYMVAGEYSFLWNGKDEQERIAATGFYMYRLEIDGETVATGRCTFIK